MSLTLKTVRDLAIRLARTLRSWWHEPARAGAAMDAASGILQRLRQAIGRWLQPGRVGARDDEAHIFRARAYAGSRRRHYLVHRPRGKSAQRARPLVLVLHGCKQDHRDIAAMSGFNALADRHGFYAAYPFITSYQGLRIRNCWGWWMDQEIHAGRGEVEDLWQIIEEIRSRYPVNARRIHVAGLSSGAGMAVALMVAQPDKIASGAAVAGVPYSEKAEAVKTMINRYPRHKPVTQVSAAMKKEMGDAGRRIPIKIIHSWQDEIVPMQSALNLRDSWGACFGIPTQHPFYDESGREGGADWEHRKYHDNRQRSIIETFFLQGPGHGWYGGQPGEYSYPNAPDTAALIWKFFKSHPLER